MSASIKQLEEGGKCIELCIPVEEVLEKYHLELNKVTNQVKLKGFRAHKVPKSLVKARFGNSIHQDVAKELVQKALSELIEKESLDLIKLPQINLEDLSLDQPIVVSAHFEEYPVVDFSRIQHTKLERPVVKLEVAYVNRHIEQLLRQKGEHKEVKRAVQQEDQVLLDYKATVDGKTFPGSMAHGVWIDMSQTQRQNLPFSGLIEQLIGLEPGKPFSLSAKMKDHYFVTSLAGKTVLVEGVIKTIHEVKAAKLDEDFIKSFDISEGTVGAFRENVRKYLTERLEKQSKMYLRKHLFEQLSKHCPMPKRPESLLEEFVLSLKEETAKHYGKTDIEVAPESILSEAQRQVDSMLLLRAFIRQNDLKVDDGDLKQYVVDRMPNAVDPQQTMQALYNNKGLYERLKSELLETKAIEKLLSEVTVQDKTVDFETFSEMKSGFLGEEADE